jgi:hypothetical protein
MSRFALTANADATALPHVAYVYLAEFDFASGFIRLSSGDRIYTHAGNTYQPFGQLASIGSVRENGELVSESLEFVLSGVDPSLITTAMTENVAGRQVTLYVAMLDENLQFVATPQEFWRGLMDQMNIQREEKTATIHIVGENRLVRWQIPNGLLYTNEHQRLIDTTDDLLSFVALMVNRVLKWGGWPTHVGRPRTPGNHDNGGKDEGAPGGTN